MNTDRPTRWGVVFAAIGAGVVSAMHFGKVPPALPELRLELGLGLVAAGWITSIYNAVGTALGIAGGAVVGLLGHRNSLIAGLLCLAAASFLGSHADGAFPLLAARAAEGVGFVIIVVAAPSLIASAAGPRHQRLAIGMWGSYMGAGMALVMVLSPALLESFGWRGLWRLNSAVALVFAAVLALATRGMAPPTGTAPRGRMARGDLGRTLARPGPWLLAGCFATYTLQWTGVVAWLPTFLIEEQGRSVLESSLLAALVIAVNVPGNLTGAWLVHRGVPRWLLMAFANGVMGLLAAGLLTLPAPDAVKFAMCLAFSYLGGVLPASVFAGVPLHAASPAFIGLTNGVVVHGANLGNLIGPPMLAVLVTMGGDWRTPSWLLLGAGALGVLLATGLRAVEKRL